MNAAAAAAPAQAEMSLVEVVTANPVMVLTDREQFTRFYEEMKRETDALEIDLTTDKGRKAIASMARRVATTKVLIDDAGKKLNEEARSRINAIDEARREIRQQLDALKEEVRRPLTEWEAAEEKREEECQQALASLRGAAAVSPEEDAADVRLRLTEVQGMTFDGARFGSYLPQAIALRDQTIAALSAAVERLEKAETERAELERLRAEAAERERKEQERAAAEEAERQRADAEKAEAERLEKLREEAAERARKEAEEAASKAQEERDRQHAEALAAGRRRAEEAERAEAERKAEAERVAAEQAKRDADRSHRSKIMAAAKEAIMEAGDVAEDAAKKIVLAITAGNVPNVTLRF
jgi:hypothetical protein